MSGWIGVDLDGTLAQYGSWQGASHIGEPVAPMVERVKRWLAEGREVRIFTARVSGPRANELEVKESIEAIQAWCVKHLGRLMPITCVKDYGMIELWDDRCVQVEQNTGRVIGQSTRGLV